MIRVLTHTLLHTGALRAGAAPNKYPSAHAWLPQPAHTLPQPTHVQKRVQYHGDGTPDTDLAHAEILSRSASMTAPRLSLTDSGGLANWQAMSGMALEW